MNVTAIIAAAGRGHRLGASVPKQFLRLGDRTILQWSVDAFAASGLVQQLVVVMPAAGDVADDHVLTPPAHVSMSIVVGGPRRQDSVANGVAAVDPAADVIVIHDGARPFVTPELIARTVDAAASSGAAIAALAATETVKRTDGRSGDLVVSETIARDHLVLVQTPQAFRREILLEALSRGRGGAAVTDEAMLVEQAGYPVRVVEGDRANVKITTPEDLAFARRLAGAAYDVAFRTGIGYDIHRTCEGRPLRLGGIDIPWHHGLLGHSDADVLCHAITDAVLGAAGAGDIGRHFPDTDPAWKDASSLDLLNRAMAIVRDRGFAVEHVDAVVIAEQPKIGPYADRMRGALAAALGVDIARVSVKGTTHEGLGAVGREEAMAAQAVATLRSTFASDAASRPRPVRSPEAG